MKVFYNKIDVLENNQSGTVSLSTGAIGATVIRALKGPEQPAFFGRGQSDLIKMVYGNPDADFYQIREAIEYNNARGLWISSPSGETGTFGGVMLLENSVEGLPSGIGSLEDSTLSSLPVNGETFGSFVNAVLTYTHILNFRKTGKDWYVKQSMTGNATDGYKFFFTYWDNVNGEYVKYNITTEYVDMQSSLVTYSTDFIAGNIIAMNINGTEITPVTYATSNEHTYDLLQAAIELIVPDATVEIDAVAHTVLIKNIETGIVTTEVTGGVSHPTSIITYSENDLEVYNFHFTNVSPVANIIGTLKLNLDTESLDFMKATIVIDNLPAFLVGGFVTFSYSNDVSADALAVIASSSKDTEESPDGKYVRFTYNKKQNIFTMSATFKQDGKEISISDYYFSLNRFKKDASGKNIYINEVFKDELFFQAIGNPDFIFTDWVETVPAAHRLTGGSRGDVSEEVMNYSRGWDYFKDKNKYKINVAFNASPKTAVIQQIFVNLRDNFQKSVYFVNCLPDMMDCNQGLDDIAEIADASINNRGISQYWNWGYIVDPDSQETYWTPLIGRVARKHALMDDIFQALQPAMVDENNHGGQLGAGILKMRYAILDDDLVDQFHEIRVNPIVKDNTFGVMILNADTTHNAEDDYTAIGHSRLADWIIDTTIKQVLVFQVVKLNDEDHRKIAWSKGDSILSILKGKPYNLLRDYGIVCDETNNTDEVLARKEFVYEMVVQFTPFSAKIRYVFSNIGQTVTVAEFIGS